MRKGNVFNDSAVVHDMDIGGAGDNTNRPAETRRAWTIETYERGWQQFQE